MIGKSMILLAGLCAAQVTGTGVAEANPCSGLFCNSTTIAKLYPASDTATPKVFVKVTDGGEASLTCGPVANSYLTLKTSHPLFNEIFATLLNATVANKKVTFRIVSGSADCDIAYVLLENP